MTRWAWILHRNKTSKVKLRNIIAVHDIFARNLAKTDKIFNSTELQACASIWKDVRICNTCKGYARIKPRVHEQKDLKAVETKAGTDV